MLFSNVFLKKKYFNFPKFEKNYEKMSWRIFITIDLNNDPIV